MADPNTHDAEYNTEAIHSDGDPWFAQEEPADETYRPHDEPLIHEYEPQDRDQNVDGAVAYTPKVNSILPDPHSPVTEEDCLHIVSYGTVEDVAIADGDESREVGLVSMSIRDEMDDLIHTDFHTLNPLSPLSRDNIKIGQRVRVDIQDYKNVIEWFVYNYPTQLEDSSLLIPHVSDGAYFRQGDICYKGSSGSLLNEPSRYIPTIADAREDDWEHHSTQPSQLDKSYIEIGQMDGNKKILLRDLLQLAQDYFHIDDMWRIIRDQEYRIVELERDARSEDVARTDITLKDIDRSYYKHLGNYYDVNFWDSKPQGVPIKFASRFYGNIEDSVFSLNAVYRDSVYIAFEPPSDPFMGSSEMIDGIEACPLFDADAIPKQFRPDQDQWVSDYGVVFTVLGGSVGLFTRMSGLDFAFRPDGSVWVDHDDLLSTLITFENGTMGAFARVETGGNTTLEWMYRPTKMNPSDPSHYSYENWHYEVYIFTFGGLVRIGKHWGSSQMAGA